MRRLGHTFVEISNRARAAFKIKQSTTARSAIITLLIGGILTKAAAFARESITAGVYGISAQYDLFLIIYMIPAAVFSTMNYAISYALIPYYHQHKTIHGAISTYRRVTSSAILVTLGSCAIPIAITFFPNLILRIVLVTNSIAEVNLAIDLLRRLIWIIPLYTAISLMQTILLAEKKFAAQALGPVIQNALIAGILIFSQHPGIVLLAHVWIIGLIGWACWLLFHYCYLNHELTDDRSGDRPTACSSCSKSFLRNAAQVLFIELWPQLYMVVDRITARMAGFETGSIASLSYAYTIYSMALSFIVTAIGQAVFPFMSSFAANSKFKEVEQMITSGMRWLILVTIPVMGAMIINANSIVALIYQRGAFDQHATEMTASGLYYYTAALVFDAVYVIFASYYYATREFSALTRGAIFAFAVKLITIYIISREVGYLGVAISTSLAALVRVLYLGAHLPINRMPTIKAVHVIGILWRTCLATALGIVAAYATTRHLIPYLPHWFGMTQKSIMIETAVSSCAMLITYLAATLWLDVPEIVELVQFQSRLKHRG